MATSFTINKIDYGNAPSGSQTWTFEYKLFNVATWTLISNSAAVNTDGSLVTPLTVSGLTAGQTYLVRASSNCESPREYFIQQISL